KYEKRTLSYQVITADLDKGTGLLKTKVYTAYPEGAYHEFGPFVPRGVEVLSTRSYKERYYHIEEPVWCDGGYDNLLFRTVHEENNLFGIILGDVYVSGPLTVYILINQNPYRIHH